MSRVICYFEGSNPEWLTTLVAMGHDTLPVSNGYDGHGRDVRLFTAKDKVAVVVGYLHKVITPDDWEATTADILHGCLTYRIPILLAVPTQFQDKARNLLGELAQSVELVDPADMVSAVEARL